MRTVPWPPGGTWALDALWARVEIGAAMKRPLRASAWGCRQGPDHRQRSVTSVEEIRHVCLGVDLDRDHLIAIAFWPARLADRRAAASSGTSSSACPSSRPRSSSLTSSTIAPGSRPGQRLSASARCGASGTTDWACLDNSAERAVPASLVPGPVPVRAALLRRTFGL
jgi:hypothetical protein